MARLLDEARDLPDDDAHFILVNYDLRYFGEYYLPHIFDREFAPGMHDEMFDMARDVEFGFVRAPVVVAGWRGCAKTAIFSETMPLHNIAVGVRDYLPDGRSVNRSKGFILFASAKHKNATKPLNTVVGELEDNDRLIEDFGHLYRSSRRGSEARQSRDWSRESATTANGIHMEVMGRKTSARLVKHRGQRPDLGILDDPQGRDDVRSKHTRDLDLTWALQTFLPLLSVTRPSNAALLGNYMDDHSIIAEFLRHGEEKGWRTALYKVYEPDPETGEKAYTWPAVFGSEWEAEQRDAMLDDDQAFGEEFLQEVVGIKASIVREDVQYYDPVADLGGPLPEVILRAPHRFWVYMAVDPSSGKRRQGGGSRKLDPTAIVPIAFDRIGGGVRYVLPIFQERIGITRQVDEIVALALVWARCLRRLGIESIAYQDVLEQLVEAESAQEGLGIPAEPIASHPSGKAQRIQRLHVPIKKGTLKFLRGQEHKGLVNEVLTILGEPEHDHRADALEMAVRLQEEECQMFYGKRGGVSAAILGRKPRVRAEEVGRGGVRVSRARL